jgi:hypothetical protein
MKKYNFLKILLGLGAVYGNVYVQLSGSYATAFGVRGFSVTLDDAGFGTVRQGEKLVKLFWLPIGKSILSVLGVSNEN